MATSTATEPDSEKNTRSQVARQQCREAACKTQGLFVHKPAEHHMRHRRKLHLHRLPYVRMVVAVASRPPAGDAVDQFAPVARARSGEPRVRATGRGGGAVFIWA